MTYNVEVKWGDLQNMSDTWNLSCARIIEHFGLPGVKYTTKLTDFGITFEFQLVEDAFVAKLLIGEN
jgi:hypothetical protein